MFRIHAPMNVTDQALSTVAVMAVGAETGMTTSCYLS